MHDRMLSWHVGWQKLGRDSSSIQPAEWTTTYYHALHYWVMVFGRCATSGIFQSQCVSQTTPPWLGGSVYVYKHQS